MNLIIKMVVYSSHSKLADDSMCSYTDWIAAVFLSGTLAYTFSMSTQGTHIEQYCINFEGEINEQFTWHIE